MGKMCVEMGNQLSGKSGKSEGGKKFISKASPASPSGALLFSATRPCPALSQGFSLQEHNGRTPGHIITSVCCCLSSYFSTGTLLHTLLGMCITKSGMNILLVLRSMNVISSLPNKVSTTISCQTSAKPSIIHQQCI